MGKKINVEFFEDIAEEVRSLSQAMQTLNSTRLTRDAIVVLLRDATKENKGTIERILFALPNLEKYYLKSSYPTNE